MFSDGVWLGISRSFFFFLRSLLYAATFRLLTDVPFVLHRIWVWGVNGFEIAWATGAIVLLGTTLGVWDGTRTKRRVSSACPACFYDLTGLPSTICPECGIDFVVRRAQLLNAHHRRKRLTIWCNALLLALIVVAMRDCEVFFDAAHGRIVVSVASGVGDDSKISAQLAGIQFGMSEGQVVAILGSPVGTSGTCLDPNCTTFTEKTLFYGTHPVHYMIGLLPRIDRTVYFGIWESGPSIHLGVRGTVEKIQNAPTIADGVCRLW